MSLVSRLRSSFLFLSSPLLPSQTILHPPPTLRTGIRVESSFPSLHDTKDQQAGDSLHAEVSLFGWLKGNTANVRARAPRSCTACADRKVKCSKTIPCTRCVYKGTAEECRREIVVVSDRLMNEQVTRFLHLQNRYSDQRGSDLSSQSGGGVSTEIKRATHDFFFPTRLINEHFIDLKLLQHEGGGNERSVTSSSATPRRNLIRQSAGYIYVPFPLPLKLSCLSDALWKLNTL